MAHQRKDFKNLKPVAIASRCTNQAEENNALLDLEAMATYFLLHRFCSYLFESSNETVVIANNKQF